MNDFKEIQNIIDEDKIQELDSSFYFKLKQRISELEMAGPVVVKIRKLHISVSVAAGLLLGLFVGGIVQQQIREDQRITQIEGVLDGCFMDEMEYEKIEAHIINEL